MTEFQNPKIELKNFLTLLEKGEWKHTTEEIEAYENDDGYTQGHLIVESSTIFENKKIYINYKETYSYNKYDEDSIESSADDAQDYIVEFDGFVVVVEDGEEMDAVRFLEDIEDTAFTKINFNVLSCTEVVGEDDDEDNEDNEDKDTNDEEYIVGEAYGSKITTEMLCDSYMKYNNIETYEYLCTAESKNRSWWLEVDFYKIGNEEYLLCIENNNRTIMALACINDDEAETIVGMDSDDGLREIFLKHLSVEEIENVALIGFLGSDAVDHKRYMVKRTEEQRQSERQTRSLVLEAAKFVQQNSTVNGDIKLNVSINIPNNSAGNRSVLETFNQVLEELDNNDHKCNFEISKTDDGQAVCKITLK
ncbi:hypothetical protein CEV31_4225 [Brucella thiophenivorans]|uniref:Uncharacterized protein n=2 Tax=Brucella thiophenivorans TaxID=571255 RepID=A0A256FTR1_9HYPH|nr:hypothetical protein CEV31_4225 [Brucella thiophenivorans]